MLLACAACKAPHVHEYANTFSSDEDAHWLEPLCGDTEEKAQFGAHIFQDGKCTVCGFEKVKPVPTSGLFSEETQPASGETLQRADALLKNIKTLGFSEGDLFVKEHVAEGANAQNLEARIENFQGMKESAGMKASLIKILPSFGGTRKQYYYADDLCAVEDFGSEKNFYRAEGTLEYLLQDVFTEIESQMNYSLALLSMKPEIGYKAGDFEIVRLGYGSGSDRSEYVFAFYEGTLSGFRAYRSYVTGVASVKQIELLVGDYGVEMPDTTGFRTFDFRPKWAAGYPGEEVFTREFVPADAETKSKIKALFKSTSSKLSKNDNTEILSEGDIYFSYRTAFSENKITFDRDDMGMKVYESSTGLLSGVGEDGNARIEHYADVGVCYEILNGETLAYLGSYAQKFYSMLFYTLKQLCEFETQYLNAENEGHPEAYEVSVNLSEFTAVKLVVPECGEMIYVYDGDGKLLAVKVILNQTEATLMIGRFDVTIPVFSDLSGAAGEPNIDYLGV